MEALTGSAHKLVAKPLMHQCLLTHALQAAPAWTSVAPTFVLDYLLNIPFNASSVSVPTSGPVPVQDPRTDEDCLFLDVHVPKKIFDKRQQGSFGGYGGYGSHGGYGGSGNHGNPNLAPVMVW